MNIDQIRIHIDRLIKEKGKNYRSLSMAIGKNEAYLHQYINKGSPRRLPEQQRRKLAALLDVDEQQLTDIKLPKSVETSPKTAQNTIIEMISPIMDKNGATSTAGFLSLPATDISTIFQAPNENIKFTRISGDSMQPTLTDGDYIFIDFAQNHLSGDGLYMIQTANTLCVRRIQQIPSGEALLICDNQNYKSVAVSLKKLKILGKALFALKAVKIG